MWILLFLSLLSPHLHAETSTITTKETDLRKEALDNAESYGLLPKNTKVLLKGINDNDYVLIEVELEEGKIEGWILQSALKASKENKKPLPTSKSKKKLKVFVPIEEAILIRRERLFFYGASAGANYGVLSGAQTDYLGLGFGFHGNVGFYLDPTWGLRFDGGYSRTAGTDARDVGIYFGFLDFAVTGSYLLEPFEFYGGLKYALGIGVSDIPSTIVLNQAGDLSSLYMVLGAGYDFPFDNITSFGVRGEYNFSLSRSPVGFQLFWFRVYVQFKG